MAKIEPGRDPQMAERTQKLNLLFAASSLGLLIALSWMVWADYDREWKQHQIRFNRLEIQNTKAQRDAALGKVGSGQMQALQAQLDKGREEMAAQRTEIAKAQAEIRKAHDEWYGIDQDFRFTKADIDVVR